MKVATVVLKVVGNSQKFLWCTINRIRIRHQQYLQNWCSIPGFDYKCPPVFLLQYTDKEEVVLWMNTVGPYHNRQETYKYFSLPFCAGSQKTISHYHETLGEALQGVELEFSGLQIKFKGTYTDFHLFRTYESARALQLKKCCSSLDVWLY